MQEPDEFAVVELAVHLFKHLRRGVTHERGEQLERYTSLPHPMREGPAQIVRATAGDLRPDTRGLEVVTDVAPRREEPSVCSGRMIERVPEEPALPIGEDGKRPPPRLSLRSADEHRRELAGDVAPLGAIGLGRAGRGREDEGDARGVVGLELREQALSFGEGQPALARPIVRRECDREKSVYLAPPEARALRELQRGAERDELFADGVVRDPFATALGNEVIDDVRAEPSEQERAILAGLVVLEEPDPVARLVLVEFDRGFRPAASPYLLRARAQE